MKRTCVNCLAYTENDTCYLGYKTKTIEYFSQGLYTGPIRRVKQIPIEECPKPLNNKNLIKEFNKKISLGR